MQQSNAQLTLEIANLTAHSRLRDMQPPCRDGETSVLGNSAEVSKVAQFHGKQPTTIPLKQLSVLSMIVSKTNSVTSNPAIRSNPQDSFRKRRRNDSMQFNAPA